MTYVQLDKTSAFKVKDAALFIRLLSLLAIHHELDSKNGTFNLWSDDGDGLLGDTHCLAVQTVSEVQALMMTLGWTPKDGGIQSEDGSALDLSDLSDGDELCVLLDVPALVRWFLLPDQVVYFRQVGFEGYRYINGLAVAIDAHGRRVGLDFHELYAMARAKGLGKAA